MTKDKQRKETPRQRSTREHRFDSWLANAVYWFKHGEQASRKERKR